ncbi:MAG: Fe-S cluster assembly protein SufD [Candidatus Sericytochromatia bacterium]
MPKVETPRDEYLESLITPASQLPAVGGRRQALREEAAIATELMRMPTVKDEAYRFLNLAALKATRFGFADRPLPEASAVAPFVVEEASCRLVFVDGRYAPALSAPGDDVAIGRLADAPEALLARHLGSLATFERDVFAALNGRFLSDGAFVHVQRGQVVDKPIHLLFLSTAEGEATASYPRALVVLEPSAEATVLEEYASLGASTCFTDAVVEIAVSENAGLSHVRVQRESQAAFHVGRVAVRLDRDARYQAKAITTGGRTARLNWDVALAGSGAEAHMSGLTMVHGEQEADTHSSVEHLVPHANCEQVNKNVVAGAAHAVFSGRVFVAKHAQSTNSQQSSRSLVLTDKGRVDTKPQLEIFADDVKCAHGATVGQLEQDEVFYLRSRGLSDAEARALLTYAFAAEIIDAIPIPSLVERLRQQVLEQTDRQGVQS